MARPGAGQDSLKVTGDERLGFERVVFFSDAVFAIAITLLALDVRLPEVAPDRVAADLPGAVLGVAPQLRVYALSFLIIAGFWTEHHRMFVHIQRYDLVLIWINVFLLLSVAFLPVPNNALLRYPGEEATVLFYAACLLFTGVWHVALWGYASGPGRLVADDLDPRVVRYISLRGVVPTAGAGLAVLLAPFNAEGATLILVLLFVATVPLGRLYFLVLRRISGARV